MDNLLNIHTRDVFLEYRRAVNLFKGKVCFMYNQFEESMDIELGHVNIFQSTSNYRGFKSISSSKESML